MTQFDKDRVRADIKAGLKPKGVTGHGIEASPDVLFVINDSKGPGDKYIHHFLQCAQDNVKSPIPVRVVYHVHRAKNAKTADMLKEAKRLVAQAGNPRAIMMSELRERYKYIDVPAAPKPPAEKRDIVELKDDIGPKYRYNSVGWGKAWNRSLDQPSGTKYYVVLDRLVAQDGGFHNAWRLVEFVGQVKTSGKFGLSRHTPVYGLKKGHKNIGQPGWVELTQHVKDEVARIMTPAKVLQLSLHLEPFSDGVYDSFLTAVAAENLLPPDSPVAKFAADLAMARAHSEPNWRSFKQVLDWASWSQGGALNFMRRWKGIKAQYPMFVAQNGYWRSDAAAALAEYVAMADAARKAKYTQQAHAAAASND